MDLIKDTAIVYTTSSWSDNDNDLAAALNSSSSRSNYDKWGVTFEYNAAAQEAHSTWESVEIPQYVNSGWDCTLDGVSNGSSGVGVRYNTYIIDDDDFSNSYSGYEFKGIALYMDNWGSFTGNEDCWFLAKDGVQYEIGTVPSAGSGIMISPVYVKLTSPNKLLLQYGSPIVINRYPVVTNNNIYHRIANEKGYTTYKNSIMTSISFDYHENQNNFLKLVTSDTGTDNTGIYANNETDSTFVDGSQKVIRVPSNDYLDNVEYGMWITSPGGLNEKILNDGGQISMNEYVFVKNIGETSSDTYTFLDFSISLKNQELGVQFTEIGDTPAYKFVGICAIYATTGIQRNFVLNEESDRCFFIARKWMDGDGNEHENEYNFNIICYAPDTLPGESRQFADTDSDIESSGFLYITPVFEAQREVYLTNPIIVNEFPNFYNIGKNGDNDIDIDKDTHLYDVTDFGYTIGSNDTTIFSTGIGGKYISKHETNEFGATFDTSAYFVELFESWMNGSSWGWKNNMGSTSIGSARCLLEPNKTEYSETSDITRMTDLHDVYINTAELDNNSLYLTIGGSCSNLSNPVGFTTEDTTIIDHQAKAGNYEMIGFVVYFKDGANDLSEIDSWVDPSGYSTYSSYFMPVWWDTPSQMGPSSSYGANIKIDFSEITDSTVFENYLAISPVYLKTDTKTIALGYAQDSTGGDLSDYVSTYTVSVTIGDTTKQYSQGDSIEVSEGDTITITLASSESGEWYAYSETFTIGGKTYIDGASIGYDNLEDGDEFHPIFSYSGETFTFKNDTARSIKVAFNGSTTSTQIDPWKEMELMGSSPESCNISILTPSNGYIEAYDGRYGENAYDLISSNGSFWNNSGNASNTTQYQANLYVSVPSKGIDIYKLDFYQGNRSCSVLTNSDSDVAVRFVALPWDSQSAEMYHLSQFINSLEDEDFKEFYLRGKLPMNLNVISYSSNKKFKSMKCETAHVVPIESSKTDEGETNEPSHDLRDIYIRENVGFDVYYIDKVSDIDSIRDTWVKNDGLADETNGDFNTLANTVTAGNGTYDEYGVFTGNGVYNFIIKGSEINAEDKSTYDYEIYNCGPLVGYVEEQDSNTPIDDEDEFFLGVTQPGSEVVTAFGWETVEGERQLMTLTEYNNTEKDGVIERPFYAPNIINPGSWSDSNGTYNDDPTGENYTTTENEVTGSLVSMEEMPKDYCAFQTGNQFIQFRLRNPYDGSVLNFDEKSAYTVNKGVWQRNVSTTTGTENETMLSDTTHEQTNFLTLWEQRSLFNALNGKPTYVNEVISYNTYNEKDLEDMALNADTASADNGATGSGSTDGNYCFPDTVWYDAYLKGVYGLRDEHGNIVTPLDGDGNPNASYQPDEDIEFIIPARNGRKAGRALVDNIDDWVQWYKREETAGVIAGGNTSAPGGTPVMFVGPLLNKEKELCIESDATRSNLTLGPGESITVPIVVLYKCYEADGRDSCKYTVGFDLRNSQYQDPLYYEFTCSARYAASVTDTVSSQKASVNSNVKYNVTVR